MSYGSAYRACALFTAACLVLGSLPAEALSPAQASAPSEFNSLAGHVFEGTGDTVLRRGVDGAGDHRVEYLYTPGSSAGRQTLRLEVAPGADRLVISALTAGAGAAPRIKLVDPAGEVFVPGQQRGNRYDDLADGRRVIRREIRRAVRAQMARGPGDIANAVDFTALMAGAWIRDEAMGNVAATIDEPMPGTWQLRVDSDVPTFVTAGSLNTATLAADIAACDPSQRASICTTFFGTAFSVIKALAIVAAGLFIAKSSLVVAGVIVSFGVGEFVGAIAKAVLDGFIGLGFPREIKVLADINEAIDTAWKSANLAIVGAAPVAALGLIANFFTGKLLDSLAEVICVALGKHGPMIPEQDLKVGIVEQDYQSLCAGDKEQCQVSTLNVKGGATFKVTKGKLPGGISLDPKTGQFQGIPFKSGLSTFTVRVTDRDGKAERKLQLWVYEAAGTRSDLVPYGMSTAEDIGAVKPNQKIRVSYGVKNDGDRAAISGQVGLYWAFAKKLDRRALIQMSNYPALSPQGDKTYSANFTVPNFGERGDSIVLFVEVDVLDTTAERTPKGKNGERNNTKNTVLAVTENAPEKVTNPRKGKTLEAGKTVSVEWGNKSGELSEVRVWLLQYGKRVAKIFDGDVGIRGRTNWKVPDKLDGAKYTIEVDSKTDPSMWARSGAFSIKPKEPDVIDLTGRWSATRTIRGPDVDPDTAKGEVDVEHNTRTGVADVLVDGTKWGSYDAVDGMLVMTFLRDSVPQNTAGTVWEGNVFNAPNLKRVVSNSGSYTAKKMNASVTLVFNVIGFGDVQVTYAFTGTKKN